MIDRTTNKKYPGINRYIERGIIVCDEWKDSFEQFYKDMGKKPEGKYSIDRINNNGNYCKANCRWATDKEQANNKSTCVYLEIDGVTKSVTQWAETTGVSRSTIYLRLKKGWDRKIAVMEPQKHKRMGISR
jgi:transcriptional regulator of acetoin/glycerol metabolism